MSFEVDYRNALLGYAPLAALVGELVSERLDQETAYPAIRFARVSTNRLYSMGGRNTMCVARVQNDCWSPDVEESLDVADKLIQALDTFSLAEANPGSPAVYPQKPNFVINQWTSNDPDADPVIWRRIVEVRMYFIDSV